MRRAVDWAGGTRTGAKSSGPAGAVVTLDLSGTSKLFGRSPAANLAHVAREKAGLDARAVVEARVREHVVDTVLSFEGDRHHALRLLRAQKHRFGSTEELGLFAMAGGGLEPVPDPSGHCTL